MRPGALTRPGRWIRTAFWLWPVLACAAPVEEPCTGVGALLPFTGGLASAATNIERALLLAAEEVSAAGGVSGQPVCVHSADTRSDLRQGLQATRELLGYHAVQALFGPQEDDLALRSLDLIRERRVVTISGGVTAPTLRFARDDGLWFRTVPSAVVLGPALARRMLEDGVRRMSVIYEGDEFGSGWATVLQVSFTTFGGTSHGIFSFTRDLKSFSDVLQRAFSPEVEAVALVASPAVGARIVEEWATSVRGKRWYFVPSLTDPVFVENIPPGSVDGMTGISPALGSEAGAFSRVFAERWQGEPPSRAAHFYYDALLLWALARELAGSQHAVVEAAHVVEALHQVSTPPGEPVSFRELGRAFDLVRAGQDIDLTGASGAVDLDAYGDVSGDQYEFWTIDQGQVVYP
ncbi:MAG: ABC transporter substrate-binding protein [Pseudomonadota bacterium]